MKTDAGYLKAAGVELAFLDCARYFHRAGGISSVAQVAKDLGAGAARALEPYAAQAKSVKPLDPSARRTPRGVQCGAWTIDPAEGPRPSCA